MLFNFYKLLLIIYKLLLIIISSNQYCGRAKCENAMVSKSWKNDYSQWIVFILSFFSKWPETRPSLSKTLLLVTKAPLCRSVCLVMKLSRSWRQSRQSRTRFGSVVSRSSRRGRSYSREVRACQPFFLFGALCLLCLCLYLSNLGGKKVTNNAEYAVTFTMAIFLALIFKNYWV